VSKDTIGGETSGGYSWKLDKFRSTDVDVELLTPICCPDIILTIDDLKLMLKVAINRYAINMSEKLQKNAIPNPYGKREAQG